MFSILALPREAKHIAERCSEWVKAWSWLLILQNSSMNEKNNAVKFLIYLCEICKWHLQINVKLRPWSLPFLSLWVFVNSFDRCQQLFDITAKSINMDLNFLSYLLPCSCSSFAQKCNHLICLWWRLYSVNLIEICALLLSSKRNRFYMAQSGRHRWSHRVCWVCWSIPYF